VGRQVAGSNPYAATTRNAVGNAISNATAAVTNRTRNDGANVTNDQTTEVATEAGGRVTTETQPQGSTPQETPVS